MTNTQLIQAALEEGFAAAAVVDTAQIPFDFSFRPYCAENLCGQFGINYSCPPDCGSCEEMQNRIQSKKRAIVLQTIWKISDYSDAPAIKQAKGAHNTASISLIQKLRQQGMSGFYGRCQRLCPLHTLCCQNRRTLPFPGFKIFLHVRLLHFCQKTV